MKRCAHVTIRSLELKTLELPLCFYLILCPSTWSRPSETCRWAQYDRNKFSSSSNMTVPNFDILNSIFFANTKLQEVVVPYAFRICGTDLCSATNDSCSTVHCVSLKSFLSPWVIATCWSSATFWVSVTYLSPASDTRLNSGIYMICSFSLTENPSGLRFPNRAYLSSSSSSCSTALLSFTLRDSHCSSHDLSTSQIVASNSSSPVLGHSLGGWAGGKAGKKVRRKTNVALLSFFYWNWQLGRGVVRPDGSYNDVL